MGLISSLNNAVSALSVNQQNLSVLSQNIANVNTPNYSAQVLNQQASFINGIAQGVSVADITRKVNDFLVAQIRTQSTTSAGADVTQTYYQQIENLLGQPGGTNSVDQNINALFTAVQTMANTPGVSAQTAVINAATTLASQISGLANSVQGLRLQADTEIANSVNTINSDLKKLYSLNSSLQHAAATGENQSGLLDDRDTTLRDLAQYMDIQTLIAPDGSVSVNTASGLTLVSSNLVQLSYSHAASNQTFNTNTALSALTASTYDQDGLAVGTVQTLVTKGVSGTNGSDSTITSKILDGKIGALIKVRDQLMPSILGQLDQLAATLRDQVNLVNNAGTSVPAPSSYTGERLTLGSSVSTYSGSMRIALLDQNGSPIASSYADEPNGMPPLTLDLSTLDTGNGAGKLSTDGIIHAINQYFAQPQAKFETGNLNNVQLALSSDSVPASGNLVNFDFSLNNISKDNAKFFVTGMTVADSTGAAVDSNPTLSVPTIALDSTNTFSTTAGSNLVTVKVGSGATLPNEGDTIYIPPVSPASTVGGIATGLISGYFKVQNAANGTFEIAIPGIDATTVTTATLGATGATAMTSYSTAAAGTTVRTGKNGLITADLSANPNSAYYTVTADIATIDNNGNVKTSTVTYRVGATTAGARNNLYGVRSATGNGGTVVQPTGGGTKLTASLVDADGNALQTKNGLYGNAQGYLKIAASNSTTSVVIDSMNSKELGNNGSGGTNTGFANYFGLNNFFKSNQLTATGDTLAGSAVNFAVNKRLTNNPTLISMAKLVQSNQPADSSLAPNYTYRVNAGDNSIAQQLAGLATGSINFGAAGGLPNVGTTFSQYAGLIIAQTSANLKNATNASTDSQTLLDGFTKQSQNVSGVNLDQELANTVIFQNAYGASTRVVTVVSQLFQDLLGIIR